MNKFDLHSAKILGILIAIIITFVMIIAHAFNYIPKDDLHTTVNEEVILPEDEENRDNSQAEEEENTQEEVQAPEVSQSKEDDYVEPHYDRRAMEKNRNNELKPLEPISEDTIKKDAEMKESAEEQDAKEQGDPLEEALNKAKDFRSNKKPISAINEYQKAISLTNDTGIKAQCYENIAIIYASAKRYGSALSAAQKAYNTAPTVSREILLARLYYKTGNIEKANTRINSVLRRDFSIE